MKVIDLLNKIANGEEPPKKIKHDNTIFRLEKFTNYRHYLEDIDNETQCVLDFDIDNLNDEVEVIEDKKIEKLKGTDNDYYINYATCNVVNKINEIIDKINEE